MVDHAIWVEKYRPKSMKECILPKEVKKAFSSFKEKNFVPNLLLCGKHGIGKTAIARAILNDCNYDYILINGSLDSNIDTLRNEIRNFASTMSFSGNRKTVILDEADNLNDHVQKALRNFVEEFSSNCGFILTANYKNKILPAHSNSRFHTVSFEVDENDKNRMILGFLNRTKYILDNEGFTYDEKVLVKIIMKYFPDYRRVLNYLQYYSNIIPNNHFDKEILKELKRNDLSDLFENLKSKNVTKTREWLVRNSLNYDSIFTDIYNNIDKYMSKSSIPQCILILAEYQYKNAFVVDKELNIMACFVELMSSCKWE